MQYIEVIESNSYDLHSTNHNIHTTVTRYISSITKKVVDRNELNAFQIFVDPFIMRQF